MTHSRRLFQLKRVDETQTQQEREKTHTALRKELHTKKLLTNTHQEHTREQTIITFLQKLPEEIHKEGRINKTQMLKNS